MAWSTFVPPRTPVINGSQLDTVASVRETKFADGYAQRIPDGINTIAVGTTLFWSGLSRSDAQAIDTTLRGFAGATPFIYQVPGDFVARQWICKKWSLPLGDGVSYQMSATLEQDFNLS